MESLLLERYNGERVEKKHSGCKMLRKWCDENGTEVSEWRVLIGIRNPYDSLVSKWLKIKSNHGGKKTGELHLEVKSGALSFATWAQLNARNFDFANHQLRRFMPCATEAIRFEFMQEDWAAFCKRHQIPHFEIPTVNQTKKHQHELDYRTYYTDELIRELTPQFAEYTNHWGYHPPLSTDAHD